MQLVMLSWLYRQRHGHQVMAVRTADNEVVNVSSWSDWERGVAEVGGYDWTDAAFQAVMSTSLLDANDA